jgi:rod shape-determining protein MreD
MMYLLFFLPVGVAALLESTWLTHVQVFGVRPDFVLITVTWMAHKTGAQQGQITGFVGGLVEDALSIAPPGFHAIVRLINGVVVGSTRGSIMNDPLLTPLVLVGIALLLRWPSALFLANLYGLVEATDRLISSRSLIHALITLILAPIIFQILDRVLGSQERNVR